MALPNPFENADVESIPFDLGGVFDGIIGGKTNYSDVSLTPKQVKIIDKAIAKEKAIIKREE